MERVKGFIYKRGGIWYIAYSDFSSKGGYARESTGSDKKRYAEKLLEQKLEIFQNRANGWTKTNAPYVDHFRDFLKMYKEGSETHKSYKGVLKLFSEFLQTKYPQIQYLHEFGTKMFDDYRIWLKDEKKTPEGKPHKDWTLKNHAKVLKTVFHQAEIWGHILKPPQINCTISIEDAKPIVTLSKEDDFKTFFDRCKELKPEYYPHYFIAARCGLRFGELTGLLWENIDLKEKNIIIRQHKGFIPKGRSKRTGQPKERMIPLTEDTIKVFKTMLRTSEYVFLKNGKPIDRKDKSFRRWIIAIVRGTKLEGMTRFHELRHTSGHIIYNMTGDLYLVKEYLGHSDIRTTERYAGKPTERMREATKKIEGFGTK